MIKFIVVWVLLLSKGYKMSLLTGIKVFIDEKAEVGIIVDGPMLMPEHGIAGTVGYSLPYYFYHALVKGGTIVKIKASHIKLAPSMEEKNCPTLG